MFKTQYSDITDTNSVLPCPNWVTSLSFTLHVLMRFLCKRNFCPKQK